MAEKKFSIWEYTPSLVAAAIFVVLFVATTFFHCFQTFKKRSLFMIALIIGGFFEWIGYITRIIARNNKDSKGIYIIQTVLLLVAPALFAASIYMVLGRIISFNRAENLSPIRVNWLTKIFVFGDVFSFLIQTGGGGLMANASSQNLGKTIVLIGLALQIIMFAIFMITSAVFHARLLKSPTTQSMTAPWAKFMYSLYFASALILIRSIFRVAEFVGGRDSALMKTEVYLYIFDAVLMWGVMVVFNFIHPGDLVGRGKGYGEEVQLN